MDDNRCTVARLPTPTSPVALSVSSLGSDALSATESLERPLWQPVAVLIASLVLIVAFTITLAFVIAPLVTGAAY